MAESGRFVERGGPTVVLLSGGRHFAASFAQEARERLGQGVRLGVVSWGPADADLSGARVSLHRVLGPRREPPAPVPPSAKGTGTPAPAPLEVASLPRRDIRRIKHGLRWRYGRVRLGVRKARARTTVRARGAAKVYDWAGHRFWHALRRDPVAWAAVRESDMLVALDGTTIRAAWQVARQDPRLEAVLGIPAARQALARRPVAASDS